MEDTGSIILILITALAAIVNGGLGYGFSSITVPVALLFYTNRVLNPAIVLIEIIINAYILVLHIHTIKTVLRRIFPILIGALPGIFIGGMLLSRINSDWVKLITYGLLLPLIFLQIGGVRKVGLSKIAGLFCGGGIGFLYAITTISGPPLAVIFTNQGFVKKEFRAAMGVIRFSLSSLTAITYFYFGFFQAENFAILTTIVPSVLVGVPIGVGIIKKLNAETFRRICLSFDVWIVSFGLSRVIAQLRIINSPYAYIFLVLAVLVDSFLLYRYFARERFHTVPIAGERA